MQGPTEPYQLAAIPLNYGQPGLSSGDPTQQQQQHDIHKHTKPSPAAVGHFSQANAKK